METRTRQQIEERIREIDDYLCNLDAGEMTEGALFCAPDTAEIAELYKEREQLLRQLARAA